MSPQINHPAWPAYESSTLRVEEPTGPWRRSWVAFRDGWDAAYREAEVKIRQESKPEWPRRVEMKPDPERVEIGYMTTPGPSWGQGEQTVAVGVDAQPPHIDDHERRLRLLERSRLLVNQKIDRTRELFQKRDDDLVDRLGRLQDKLDGFDDDSVGIKASLERLDGRVTETARRVPGGLDRHLDHIYKVLDRLTADDTQGEQPDADPATAVLLDRFAEARGREYREIMARFEELQTRIAGMLEGVRAEIRRYGQDPDGG